MTALNSPTVLIDFDGTIATCDTVDAILAEFALPEWREIEDRWQAGEITSKTCMAEQIALIRATPAELNAFIDTLAIDADFEATLQACARHGARAIVVSDGLDYTVKRLFDRAGLKAEVHSNHLRPIGNDRWSLSFPFENTSCVIGAGNCKCATVETATILIGDGRSDFCVAQSADVVFAKDALAAHCAEAGIPFQSFRSFHDIAGVIGTAIDSLNRDDVDSLRVGVPING
ncbi:MAG: MtnX-like HAD-IB family phosphatase [Pseudomonadota bacterium]